MRTYKTEGVILKKREIGEKDYIITLFTPLHGKIDASVRGARSIKSRFNGYLDILNTCTFEIYESPKNFIITECELKINYERFRCDLSKFYIGSKISELVINYTTENENHEEIYGLLTETLAAVDEFSKESIIIEAFKIKLFNFVGIMPNLYSLHETEFENLDLRFKKLLNFLLTRPYGDIIRLYVEQKDLSNLVNMTNSLQSFC